MNHGRLYRLLKLVQRNPGSTPPKAIFDRWNNFCDARSPQEGGRPVRDPKKLGMDLILAFLCEELPKNFWVFLVKKVQSYFRSSGSHDHWTDFCDAHAPRLDRNRNAATRDPRNLESRFLINFVACSLDHDNSDGGIARIVDDFQFDFTMDDRSGRPPSDNYSTAVIPARKGGAAGPRQHSAGPIGRQPEPAAGPVIKAISTNRGRSRSPRRDRGGPAWPSEVPKQHGSLHRLLKLVQRNQGLTPPKEVFTRWNEYCDKNSPLPSESDLGFTPHNPRPIRDPKLLSKDIIYRFLVEELPRGFWVSLIKKLQGDSAAGFGKVWEAFCDRHAPPLPSGKGSIRDPRNLEPGFLIAFVVDALDKDDADGRLAHIVDSFQFIFTDVPEDRAQQPGRQQGGAQTSDWRDGRQGKDAGKAGGRGRGRPKAGARGGGAGSAGADVAAAPPAPEEQVEGLSTESLSRMVRLLQRSAKSVKKRWDTYCDENAPPHTKGGKGVRDPRLHAAGFLRSFLSQEVPFNLWTEAVNRSLAASSAVADMWENITSSRDESESGDIWSDGVALLEFLCSAGEKYQEVGDAVGVVAAQLDKDGSLDGGAGAGAEEGANNDGGGVEEGANDDGGGGGAEEGAIDDGGGGEEDNMEGERLQYRFVNSGATKDQDHVDTATEDEVQRLQEKMLALQEQLQEATGEVSGHDATERPASDGTPRGI